MSKGANLAPQDIKIDFAVKQYRKYTMTMQLVVNYLTGNRRVQPV